MSTEQRQSLEVFFSYAREDEVLRTELEKHLRILELQGFIKGWHDRDINAGIDWSHEIHKHLNSAHIILLLVSPDFLASRYCYSIEMRRAMERHYAKEAYVIPIILRPIYWKGAPFASLQVLPTDAKPVTSWRSSDEAFLNVTTGIRAVIERFTLLLPSDSSDKSHETIFLYPHNIRHQESSFCPYRGLHTFREQDAPFFCGRDIFAEQLLERVHKQSFVAVVGPSGSGKSSLVLAGLLPRLRYEGKWQIATFRPSERPFHALASTLISLLEPGLDEIDRLIRVNKLADPLQQGDISLYDVVERIADRQSCQLLLFADQFEELYTRCSTREDRERFLDVLVETIRIISQSQQQRCTLLITLRADFLGQALLYRPFADAFQSTDFKISPMNRQELQEAIIRPVEQFGVNIESGLTQRLVDAVYQEPGNLPLLEFTLALLWAKQSKGMLTHTAYQEIGEVENAVADYAEGVFAKFSEHEQLQARQVFVQLVYLGEGTEDTRRTAKRSQIKEEHWNLVLRLSDARLVICGRDESTGEEVVEMVHEALIKGWKRFRCWIEEDREWRLWQERLRGALRQWEKSERDDGALLRGALLVEAQRWLALYPDAMNSLEQAFVEVSQRYERQEAQRWKDLYEEAERQREQARRLQQAATAIFHISSLSGGPSALPRVLDRTLQAIQEITGSRYYAVLLLDQPITRNMDSNLDVPAHTVQAVTIAAQKGFHTNSMNWRPLANKRLLLGHAIKQRDAMIVTDTSTIPDIDFPFLDENGRPFRPGSALCVPIFEQYAFDREPEIPPKANDEEKGLTIAVMGTIEVYHRDVHNFPAEDVELLRQFAQHVALAILNARLYRSVNRLARTANRQARQKENIMHVVPGSIVILDPQGRIADINPATKKLFGWSEDVIGLPMQQVVANSAVTYADDFVRVLSSIDELERRALMSYKEETSIITPDGQQRTINCSYACIRDELGDIFAFIIFIMA